MTTDSDADSTIGATVRTQQPIDWGRGHYETTAAAIAPAATTLVRAAHLRPGERVLDLGCGTGTVALIASRIGAHVTGADPAARLLEVARGLAQREGLDVQFLAGDAASIPLPDRAVDVVLSNFGVIFAPEAPAAVQEMVRVLSPEGRIAFSAWVPGGAIGQMNAASMDLVRKALGAPAPPAPFAWHDETAQADLFAGFGMTIAVEQHELAFTAASPAAYLDAQLNNHPLAVAGGEVLERAGMADQAQERLLQVLEDGNEDPDAFLATSRYVVVTATGR